MGGFPSETEYEISVEIPTLKEQVVAKDKKLQEVGYKNYSK